MDGTDLQRLLSIERRGVKALLGDYLTGFAWMLFARGPHGYYLLERDGYRDEGFYYRFLVDEPELLARIDERGMLTLAADYCESSGCALQICVEPADSAELLLLIEKPAGVAWLSDEWLRLLLARESHDRLSRLRYLPSWLAVAAHNLSQKESQQVVLLLSESGSGSEQVVEAVIDLLYRSGEAAAHFYPGNLSAEIQLRELFGDSAGVRLARGDGVVPLLEQGRRVVVVHEVADLALPVQARIMSHLRESGAGGVRWLFLSSRDLRSLATTGAAEAELVDQLESNCELIMPLRALQEELRRELPQLLGRLGGEWCRKLELSEGAIEELLGYEWPGNYQQLISVLRFSATIAGAQRLDAKDLFFNVDHEPEYGLGFTGLDLRQRTALLERELLLEAWALHGGNQVHMARALGISRGSLQYRLGRLGLSGGESG